MSVPLERQLDAAMGKALAVETIGDAELPQQLDRRVFEHPGADAVLDVVTVARFEHDAVDAPRWTAGARARGRPAPRRR